MKMQPATPLHSVCVVAQDATRVQKCQCCAELLPASEFYSPRGTPSGLSAYCRSCCSDKTLEMLERRLPVRNIPSSKVCSRCRQTRPSSEFYKSWSAASGLHSQCIPCYLASIAERKQRRTLGEGS